MKTSGEYLESIRQMNYELYVDGEKITDVLSHPIVAAQAAALAATYDFQNSPQLEEFFVTTSHLTGERISRFQHVAQSTDDLLRKVELTRYCNRQLGQCSFRCLPNAFVPLLYVTDRIDEVHGTNYHHNAVEWIKYVQREDLITCPALTDPKGDRRVQAHKQENPNMYLRVVKKNEEGIVIQGAKVAQTGTMVSHEKLIVPSTTHYPGSEAYAVCCAVPGNAKGIIHISARHMGDSRRYEGLEVDMGNARYGIHETVEVFDNVFVPWERVFMCGEVEFVGEMVNLAGAAHRPTTGACKSGWADVLIGAVALAAEHTGLHRVSHVRDKLADMIHLSETIYSCGIAAAYKGVKLGNAGYIPDPVLANNTKYFASKAVYDLIRLAEDITGGVLATLPSEKEFKNPEIADHLQWIYCGANGTPAEHRARIVRLIENLTFGMGSFAHSAAHGGGSGQACKMCLYEFSDLNVHKRLAKRIAGVD